MASKSSAFLVDQSASARNAIEFLLANAGFIVHTTDSWQILLSAYESAQVDLVVVNTEILTVEAVSLMEIAVINEKSSLLCYLLKDNLITEVVALRPQSTFQIKQPVELEKLLIAVQELCDTAAKEARRKEEVRLVNKRLKDLTPSEQKILQLLAQGCTAADIAQQRRTSLSTVQNQRASILKKLQARSTADAVRMCFLAAQDEDAKRP